MGRVALDSAEVRGPCGSCATEPLASGASSLAPAGVLEGTLRRSQHVPRTPRSQGLAMRQPPAMSKDMHSANGGGPSWDDDPCSQNGWAQLPRLGAGGFTSAPSTVRRSGASPTLSPRRTHTPPPKTNGYPDAKNAPPAFSELAELDRIIEQAKQVQDQLLSGIPHFADSQRLEPTEPGGCSCRGSPRDGGPAGFSEPVTTEAGNACRSNSVPPGYGSRSCRAAHAGQMCWPATPAMGPPWYAWYPPPLPPASQELDARLSAMEAARATEVSSQVEHTANLRRAAEELLDSVRKKAIQAEVDRLRTELSGERAKADVDAHVAEAEACAEAARLLREANDEVDALKTEIRRQQAELDDRAAREGEADRIRAETQELRSALDTATVARKELREKMEALYAELEQAWSELARASSGRDEERRLRLDADDRYQALEGTLEQLRSSGRKLQASEQTAREEADGLRQEADRLLVELREEIKQLQAAVEREQTGRLTAEQRHRSMEDEFLSRLRQEKHDHAQELDAERNARSEVERLQQAAEAYHHGLREEMASSVKELKELRSALDLERSVRQTLEQRCSEVEASGLGHREDAATAAQEAQQLKSVLAVERSTREGREQRCNELEADLRKLRFELSEAIKALEKSQMEFKSLQVLQLQEQRARKDAEERLRPLESELREQNILRQKLQTMEEEREALRQKLEEERKSSRSTQLQLSTERDALLSRMKEEQTLLRQKLDKEMQERRTLQLNATSEVENLEREVLEEQERCQTLVQEKDSLRQKVEKLDEERQSLRENLDELTQARERDKQKLQHRVEELQQRVSEEGSAREVLQQKLDKDLDGTQKTLQQLQLERSSLQLKLVEAETKANRFAEVEQQLQRANSRNDDLVKERDRFASDAEHWRKAAERRRQAEQSLRDAMDAKLREVAVLQQAASFDGVDTNGDGVVSREEYMQAQQRHSQVLPNISTTGMQLKSEILPLASNLGILSPRISRPGISSPFVAQMQTIPVQLSSSEQISRIPTQSLDVRADDSSVMIDLTEGNSKEEEGRRTWQRSSTFGSVVDMTSRASRASSAGGAIDMTGAQPSGVPSRNVSIDMTAPSPRNTSSVDMRSEASEDGLPAGLATSKVT